MGINLLARFKNALSPKKTMIIHIGHYKCGMHWFSFMMGEIAERFNLKFQACRQEELKKDTDIWFFHDGDCNKVNFEKLKRQYRGSHMIRDPRDKITSAYFYDKWSEEEWIRKKIGNFGISFQDFLNSLNKEDGLLFEIIELWNNIRWKRGSWDIHNRKILELKYEEVIKDPKKWFPIIFRHWGFKEKDMPVLMEIARRHHFTRKAKRRLGEEKKGEHLRQGMPGNWKKHFSPKVKKIFKNILGDWLIKLGYEKDKNW